MMAHAPLHAGEVLVVLEPLERPDMRRASVEASLDVVVAVTSFWRDDNEDRMRLQPVQLIGEMMPVDDDCCCTHPAVASRMLDYHRKWLRMAVRRSSPAVLCCWRRWPLEND